MCFFRLKYGHFFHFLLFFVPCCIPIKFFIHGGDGEDPRSQQNSSNSHNKLGVSKSNKVVQTYREKDEGGGGGGGCGGGHTSTQRIVNSNSKVQQHNKEKTINVTKNYNNNSSSSSGLKSSLAVKSMSSSMNSEYCEREEITTEQTNNNNGKSNKQKLNNNNNKLAARRVSSYKDIGIVKNDSSSCLRFIPKQSSVDDPTSVHQCLSPNLEYSTYFEKHNLM